ncbi:ATG36 (YJL185C) [Zygosaccharomyces parabailii]|nr:ATG36 (YJL185C) [Zygosaccharomyces parabailii]
MTMFNGFVRQRGSWSAMQATIAYTSSQDAYPSDVEIDCESIDSFGDIRVLNNPGFDNGTISDESKKESEENEEITSGELAILSTTTSSLSGVSLDQLHPDLYAVRSDNSQRIEEWCLRNENATDTLFQGDFQWRKDGVDNYTSKVLGHLNKDQISAVRRFSRDLLPMLRQSRRNSTQFPHRYRDIPSVFYMGSSSELRSCSQELRDYDDFGNSSWFGWTMVARLTDSDICHF